MPRQLEHVLGWTSEGTGRLIWPPCVCRQLGWTTGARSAAALESGKLWLHLEILWKKKKNVRTRATGACRRMNCRGINQYGGYYGYVACSLGFSAQLKIKQRTLLITYLTIWTVGDIHHSKQLDTVKNLHSSHILTLLDRSVYLDLVSNVIYSSSEGVIVLHKFYSGSP